MLAYFFVLLAVVVRFMPHPWGFAPVAASLLFFGARGSRNQIWAPLVLLAASDVVLTKLVYHYPFLWDNLVTWAWYAAILLLGTNLREKANPVRVIAASLASSTSFFLISNFATWTALDMYPKNLSGLMMSYAAGLPFFNRSVKGDLMFTCAMFATPVLLHMLLQSFKSSDREAAA
jgi:hypothetical protein